MSEIKPKFICPICGCYANKKDNFTYHLGQKHGLLRVEFINMFPEHDFSLLPYKSYNCRSKKLLAQEKEKYFQNPNKCLQCEKELDWKERNNKFCSNSCGASYNNKLRDYSTFYTEDLRARISSSVKAWRKNNPNKVFRMHQNQIKNRSKRFSSKGEKELLSLIKERFPEYLFTFGGFRISIDKTTSLDMFSKEIKLIIEYDGPHHFFDIYGTHEKTKQRDLLLNQWCIDNNWKIIRVNETTFKKRKEEVLNFIFNLIENHEKIPNISILYWEDQVL